MLTLLALFVEPAYPRNEYLNDYGDQDVVRMEVEQKDEILIIIIVIVVQLTNNSRFKFHIQKIFRCQPDCKTVQMKTYGTKTTIRINEDVWSS